MLSSIRSRIFCAVIGVTLLTGLLIGSYAVSTSIRGKTRESAEVLQTVAAIVSQRIADWRETLVRDLELVAVIHHDGLLSLLSASGSGSAVASERQLRELSGFIGITRRFDELFLMDADGFTVLSTNSASVGIYQGLQDFFLRGMKGPAVLIQTLSYSSTSEGLNNVVAVRPVRDASGRLLGVLAGRANLALLNELLTTVSRLGTSGECYLVGMNRVLLTPSRFSGYAPGQSFIDSHGVDHALRERSNGLAEYPDYRGIEVLGAYSWLPALQMALLVEIDSSEVYSVAYRQGASSLLIIVAVVLLAAALSLLVARHIAAPLIALANTARGIAGESRDFSVQVPCLERQDELGQMARAFRDMLGALRSSIDGLENEVRTSAAFAEALRVSEERHRAIVDNAGLGIAQVDRNGRFLHVNAALCAMLGYEADTLTSLRWQDVTHAADVEQDEALAASVYAGERQDYHLEKRLVTSQGRMLWAQQIVTALRDATGQVASLVLLCEDVTSKKLHRELLNIRLDLRQYADTHGIDKLVTTTLEEAERLTSSSIGFFHFVLPDQDTIELYSWSPNTLRHCTAAGKGVHYPIDRAGVWVDCVREKQPVVHNDYESLAHKKGLPGGHVPVLRELVVPVFNEGKIFAILGVGNKPYDYDQNDLSVVTQLATSAVDVLLRRRAEEELRRLRNYLQNIVDSMPSVLVAVDAQGRITQWNREAALSTGCRSEQALGQPLETIYPALAVEMERGRKAIRTREVQHEVRRPSLRAGETHFEDVTVFPLVTNGAEGAVIRVDDVTERARLEQMMIQSEKMLSVGGLAAGMAHEINNPLAAVLGYTHNIKRRLLDATIKNQEAARECGISLDGLRDYLTRRDIPEMLEGISQSGERAALIVSNMLSFGRKSEKYFERQRLDSLLDNTLELAAMDYDLKKNYDFRQIEIVREYAQDMAPAMCDRNEIQQVLLNLLKNAAEAMGEKSYTDARPRLILRANMDHGMACVEIEDNGPGMDEAVRKRVFEPFFTTKPVDRGTGLGLSVSYFIVVEQHGGVMEVSSTPGNGARFSIKLRAESRESGS